ncbi:UTP--glucose-1-phosphate uridylyltransferase GalU [Effusibacillus lacus]|uniref:UTP--glucose-1-phosphate uridylyltransferase n=1 Tax=Effusibacillus lacus TaxID=1348429 RepID=A0A292YU60_9BACL|nr:UTP--glucose-1-phosphate uridylyltransferase GalU [Effusibacillus lacus]TCS73759.1 UDP-glucose pyrophosphorylase [Effusibacillus lacus]GAX92030.1 UTP--glucose-1-phosphate uridylyltransferase [Effusibacillus lacus]
MTIRKAVIPAAGLGTRFLPATKAQPKEMLPIVDKPTIQYIIEEAVASGIEDILIITGRNKRAIEDHFDRSVELELMLESKEQQQLLAETRRISNMANIHYIRQKEALGLGHAVLCAKNFIGSEPFAVLLGDDIVNSRKPGLRQLIDIYERNGGSVLGVQQVPLHETNRYGMIHPERLGDREYRVHHVVEKPPSNPPSQLAIMGRYILAPEVFAYLEATEPGVGGEIQLTDAIDALCKNHSVFACEIEGRRYDIGDKLGYLKANIEFALEREEMKDKLEEYLRGWCAEYLENRN